MRTIRGVFSYGDRGYERSPRPLTREIYRGVVLGLAVGNALGLPGEGKSRGALRRLFPDGLTEIDPAERQRPWDDDTAQSVILAEALLDDPRLDLIDFASRLVRWAIENGRGIGNLTRRVIAKLESETPVDNAAREVWEEDGREPAGNGAVMRCAPVALRWMRSLEPLIGVTMRSARITHHDSRCGWSAVAVNAALALCLGGTIVDLEDLAGLLDGEGADTRVTAAVRGVRGRALAHLRLDERETMGYTLKAMQVGLWVLQQEPDFETVLVEVVNAGGDTDTNAAIAGAVMGGRVGLAGIPPRWRGSIRDPDHLIALADRLFDASEGSASRSGNARLSSVKGDPENEAGVAFDIADLQRRGFQGPKPVKELRDNAQGVPKVPGVYVVVRSDDTPPRFLMRNPAGRYGGDPTVRVSQLEAKWIQGAQTLYIGRAKKSLKKRIAQLVKYSRGRKVAHRGGRFLWQVEGSSNFQVAWLEDKNPTGKERKLLREFEGCFGRLPFANLRRERQNA